MISTLKPIAPGRFQPQWPAKAAFAEQQSESICGYIYLKKDPHATRRTRQHSHPNDRAKAATCVPLGTKNEWRMAVSVGVTVDCTVNVNAVQKKAQRDCAIEREPFDEKKFRSYHSKPNHTEHAQREVIFKCGSSLLKAITTEFTPLKYYRTAARVPNV